jgi:hypothetical protein
MSLTSALKAILSVLEDETTDDISKWRDLCFTQITRLRIAEFQHFQEDVTYQKNRDQLSYDLTRVSRERDAALEARAQLEAELARFGAIRQRLAESFGHRKSGTDSSTVLLVSIEKAPQVFRNILQGHEVARLPDVERRFRQANKEITALSARINGVEHKLQVLIQRVQNRRSDVAHGERLRTRMQSELAELKEAFSRIELPAFAPEIDRIASQFENSTEASKMLFSIENATVELEARISAIHLDNRPSECAILEGLIEKERISQNAMIQNLIEKYNTDTLDEEAERARAAIQELSTELQRVKESAEIKGSHISNKFKRKGGEMLAEIAQNEEAIQMLGEQIENLSSRMPVRVDIPKVSVATEAVFSVPRFF